MSDTTRMQDHKCLILLGIHINKLFSIQIENLIYYFQNFGYWIQKLILNLFLFNNANDFEINIGSEFILNIYLQKWLELHCRLYYVQNENSTVEEKTRPNHFQSWIKK